MPKQLSSDIEVVAYVAHTKGAIGYVSGSASTEGVKVLVVSDEGNAQRKLVTRVEPEYPETLKKFNIGGNPAPVGEYRAEGTVEKVVVLGESDSRRSRCKGSAAVSVRCRRHLTLS
jgi:hypothetical protein